MPPIDDIGSTSVDHSYHGRLAPEAEKPFKPRKYQHASRVDLVVHMVKELFPLLVIAAIIVLALSGAVTFLRLGDLVPVVAIWHWVGILVCLALCIVGFIAAMVYNCLMSLKAQNVDPYHTEGNNCLKDMTYEKEAVVDTLLVEHFQSRNRHCGHPLRTEWDKLCKDRDDTLGRLREFLNGESYDGRDFARLGRWFISDGERLELRTKAENYLTISRGNARYHYKKLEGFHKSLMTRITVNTETMLSTVEGGKGGIDGVM